MPLLQVEKPRVYLNHEICRYFPAPRVQVRALATSQIRARAKARLFLSEDLGFLRKETGVLRRGGVSRLGVESGLWVALQSAIPTV